MDSRNTDNQQQVGLVKDQDDPRAYALAEKSAQEQRENGQLVTAVQMGTLTPIEDTSCVNGKNVAGIQHVITRATEDAKRKKDQHHFQWLLDELDRQIEAIQERINQLTQDLADAQRRREAAQANHERLSEEAELIQELSALHLGERWTAENRKRFEAVTGKSTKGITLAELNLILEERAYKNGSELGQAYEEFSQAQTDEGNIQAEIKSWTRQLTEAKQRREEVLGLSADQDGRAMKIWDTSRSIAAETQGHDFHSRSEKQHLDQLESKALRTAEFEVNDDVLTQLNQSLKLSF
jgi:chromosome segregation ATPase